MNSNKNILFITQWQFNDALIQTYTLPYVDIIRKLGVFKEHYLVVFNKTISSEKRFHYNGITVIELPFEYITYSTFFKIYSHLKNIVVADQITHLHPWCTTAGTFGLLLKLKFKSRLDLIIDSFEPHAETMIENGEWNKNSLKFKFLFHSEKMQVKHSSHLIFTTEGMQNYILEKYHIKSNNYFVKPACVDLDHFEPNDVIRKELRKELNLSDKIVCIYAGKMGGIYLEKEIFVFAGLCHKHWGDRFRFLLLSNMTDRELEEKCIENHLAKNLFVKQFVPHKDVANLMNVADFAICPVKPIPSKKYCSPIKNGEYWAMGLPVIITDNISNDSELISENNIGAVWNELNEKAFIHSILNIDNLLKGDVSSLRDKIRSIAKKNRSFELAEFVYQNIYGV